MRSRSGDETTRSSNGSGSQAPSRFRCWREVSSAGSSGILCEWLVRLAAVVFMDPLLDLRGGQLPLRLDDGALAVEPLRLDRVQPRRLDREVADPDLAPALSLHLP